MGGAGPNVVLVVLDTARADAFEPWGARPGSSPAIAQLARAGAAQPAALAPVGWTLPSHAALFTGLLPRDLGLHLVIDQSSAGYHAALETHRERMLAEVLRRAGWATAAVSTNPVVHEVNGLAYGFERFDSLFIERANGIRPQGWRSKAAWVLEALAARLDDGALAVERLLADWLRRRDDRPFFWFVNLMECHSPYLPPRPFSPLGPADRVRAAVEAGQWLNFSAICAVSAGAPTVPEPVLERMRLLYAGAIAQLDAWIARLLHMLDASGVLDDTELVITADHGENLGDGGLLGHAFSLDDRLLRVPFVSAGPLTPPSAAGAWSLAQVPSWLGDELGIEHPWTERWPDGIVVSQHDSSRAPDDAVVRDIADEWDLASAAVARMCRSFQCASDGRYKLFRDPLGETWVDLEADPLELRPLAAPPASIVPPKATAMRRALDEAESSAGVVVAPPTTGARHPDAARLAAQLELLGYA